MGEAASDEHDAHEDRGAAAILGAILSEGAEPPAGTSLADWWQRFRATGSRFSVPVDRAIAGGFASDRLAYAFASGYQAAGLAMFPALAAVERLGAFCATEQGGNHPRAIETKLEKTADGAFTLTGRKTFVTMGEAAELLLVVASTGAAADGRNRLCVVAVDQRDGVKITAAAETPFVPEIPHAVVAFDAARIEPHEVLPGDGYERYLKPFRTVEDCHVQAAFLGWLVQVGRRSGWRREVLEDIAALLATLRSLATSDPTSPAVHVALGSTLRTCGRLIAEVDELWASVDAPTRTRWERDRKLLGVAGAARVRRLEAAWERLSG